MFTEEYAAGGSGGMMEEVHHAKLEDPRKHESILHNLYMIIIDIMKWRGGQNRILLLTDEQVQEVIAYMNEVSKIA